MAGHGVDLLDDSVRALGVRPHGVGETDSVYLVDGARPAFHLRRGHIEDDKATVL